MIGTKDMPSPCLKKTASIFMSVALYCYTSVASGEEMTPCHLSAGVSNIHYLNDDNYRVEIVLANTSSELAVLEGYEAFCSAQSEILGRWIDLVCHEEIDSGLNPGLDLPAQMESKATMIMSIPLSNPHLYRNHEGDVNVRIIYKLKISRCGSGSNYESVEERAYWIAPRTDRWILREGM
jgi:hypothetical protein